VALLEVTGLTTEFRTGRGMLRAVDAVSFQVNAGETLAIVGESGSGKSVTALSVMRLVPDPPGRIAGGSIRFDGQELLALSDPAMRAIRGNQIAMIFQEPMSALNPSIQIGRQIAEPLNVHRGMSWSRALEAAKSLLDRARVPDAAQRIDAWPHQFSGGMRQRAMIAMALACEPKLLIADEPTTALDVTVQAQILDLLKDITRDSGSSLILITHNLGIVARYADRIAVMYGGRIIESGSARTIFEHPAHPYTAGLMASVPRLDSTAKSHLFAIEGNPPDLAALPAGCAFAPRCPQRIAACQTTRPVLAEIARDHHAACLLHAA
jgi:peptide/nickel transport system ATP-binding protein